MIEVNDLMITTSAVRKVSDVDIFNIHVQDLRNLSKYAFINLVYPFMDIASKSGFSDEEAIEVKKICSENIEEIKESAYSLGEMDDTVPEDIACVLVRHNLM